MYMYIYIYITYIQFECNILLYSLSIIYRCVYIYIYINMDRLVYIYICMYEQIYLYCTENILYIKSIYIYMLYTIYSALQIQLHSMIQLDSIGSNNFDRIDSLEPHVHQAEISEMLRFDQIHPKITDSIECYGSDSCWFD